MQNIELIVLNITKFKDNAIVLHTLAKGYGRKSFIVNVSKGSSMAMFLPMNIIEADIVENSRSTLWRARNFSTSHTLSNIRSNLYKNTMTLFMSEVLFRAIREGADEEGLFEWCVKDVLALDAIESDFSNFHLRFLLDLAVALGFAPSVEGLMPFAGNRLDEITALLRSSYAESMLIPMNGAIRNEVAESLLRYLSFHLDSALNIQSLKILRELYCQNNR